jgi:hypothetical protein
MKTTEEILEFIQYMIDERKELMDSGYDHWTSSYIALVDVREFITGEEYED